MVDVVYVLALTAAHCYCPSYAILGPSLTLQGLPVVADKVRSNVSGLRPFRSKYGVPQPHTQNASAVLVPDKPARPPASAWRTWRQRPTAGLAQQALGTQRTCPENGTRALASQACTEPW